MDALSARNPDEMPQVVTHFQHPPYDQLLCEILLDRWLVERVDRLARPEGLRFCDIEDATYEFPVIMCRPTLTANIFALRTQYARAVVLVNYATGTTPEWLAPVIKKLTENGVPVFLVADCPGDQAGITKIGYEACTPALDAGAKPIEKVNVRDVGLVKQAVRDSAETMSGQELADYIYRMFAYQEGEERPKPRWESPDYIATYRKEVVEPMLRRLGFKGGQVAELSEMWGTVPGDEFFRIVTRRADS